MRKKVEAMSEAELYEALNYYETRARYVRFVISEKFPGGSK